MGGNKVVYPLRKELLSVFTEWVRATDVNHFTIDNRSLTPRRLIKNFFLDAIAEFNHSTSCPFRITVVVLCRFLFGWDL